jgi:pyruvate oxidase
MEQCDLCLLVGTNYPYLEFLPKRATIMQIDWEASQIGLRHVVDLGLVGSAEPTLKELIRRIEPRDATPFVRRLGQERRTWLSNLTKEAEHQGTKGAINPLWVADRLSKLVDANANIAVDVGNTLVWMARNFRSRNHGWLVSAWLGSMGFGLPAAIAAKIVQPERQSLAVVGDGGFAMLMADFVTAVKYGWPITVVVFNNRRLGMIKFEQEVHGIAEFGTHLFNPDFAAYADAAGGRGFRVDAPDAVEPALREALAESRPSIVDVYTDADVKPLPPRITWSEAMGYAEAMFREVLHV